MAEDNQEQNAVAACAPVRFEDHDKMIMAGLVEHYGFDKMDGIKDQWHRFVPLLMVMPARVDEKMVAYGVVEGNADRTGCEYMTAAEVHGGADLASELTTREVPPHRYAVFAHEGHLTAMPQTLANIFRQWLPQSGMQMARNPDFLERYGAGFNPDTGTGDIEVWVPVEY